jgi:hypothetical protein
MRGAVILGIGLTFTGLECQHSGKINGGLENSVFIALIGAEMEKFSPLSSDNAVVAEQFFFFNHCESHIACYFNLGNAQFLAGKLPEAIRSYQRGLNLDPNDAGLRENLSYARAKVVQPYGALGQPEPDIWPAWLYEPSSFQTAAALLFFYSLTCFFLTRWFMTRRRGLIGAACVTFLLAALSGGVWLYLEGKGQWHQTHPLVVIREDKLPLRKGNGASYQANPDMPVLSRGMEARRIGERGGWLQIQFAGGPIGWVQKGSVIVDE